MLNFLIYFKIKGMMFSLYFKEYYLRQRITDDMLIKKFGLFGYLIPRTVISACKIKFN